MDYFNFLTSFDFVIGVVAGFFISMIIRGNINIKINGKVTKDE